jgi:hypothetical protein
MRGLHARVLAIFVRIDARAEDGAVILKHRHNLLVRRVISLVPDVDCITAKCVIINSISNLSRKTQE